MSVHQKWWRRWNSVVQRARPPRFASPSHALTLEDNDASTARIFDASSPRTPDSNPPRAAMNNTPNPNGARAGVRAMPRPAIKWVGHGARIALRSFDFAADADAVCAFQEETYTTNFPEFAFSSEFAQAFRHDLRRSSLDPNHALFVLDDGHIAGFLWLVVCENNWTRERYGYINNIYLAPEQRAQGLSDELMAQADAFFRNRRIHRIRLTVTASNRAAIALYHRSGYNTTRWEMEKEL